MAMWNYFDRQIKLIEESRSLRILAFCFSLVYIVIFFSGWIDDWWIPYYLSSSTAPICSALFENCYQYRLPFEAWKILWWIFGSLTFICSGLIAFKKIRAAYGLFVFLTLFEIFIPFADYRMWYSHFYISAFVILPFLFLEPKPLLSAVMIALCYWWAGCLKINSDWLSGQTLISFWHVFPQWLPAQAAFAVFMELILVWLLFSKRPKVFWPTFAVFVIFHLLSWHVVGFFYPLVMFSLLPAFIVLHRSSYDWKGLLKPAPILFAAAFCALQIPPYLQKPSAALHGGGRMFYSLYMFHRHIQCQTEAGYIENGEEKKIDLRQVAGPDVTIRLACEPLVSINAARYLCRTKNFSSPLHVVHRSKFIGDADFQKIYEFEDFCHQNISYHFWGDNPWMNRVKD